jgi:hypothetical protein
MGCTSSNQTGTTKGSTNLPPVTIADDGQQLINDQFRKWLKTNRPKADEYVLNDVLLTAQPSNEVEDYKTIVGKALDLLAERHDIKSTNKLGKLVQKEIVLASPKKVAHTIGVLKQTADKLRAGNIQLETEQQITTNNEVKFYPLFNQIKLNNFLSRSLMVQLHLELNKVKCYQVNLVYL